MLRHLLNVVLFGIVLGVLAVFSPAVPLEVLVGLCLTVVLVALAVDIRSTLRERRAAAEAEREAEIDYLVAVSRGRV